MFDNLKKQEFDRGNSWEFTKPRMQKDCYRTQHGTKSFFIEQFVKILKAMFILFFKRKLFIWRLFNLVLSTFYESLHLYNSLLFFVVASRILHLFWTCILPHVLALWLWFMSVEIIYAMNTITVAINSNPLIWSAW